MRDVLYIDVFSKGASIFSAGVYAARVTHLTSMACNYFKSGLTAHGASAAISTNFSNWTLKLYSLSTMEEISDKAS
jgi:hypothetical protein